MSTTPVSVDLPYGIPKILDLTSGRARRTREGLAEILFVSRAQLDEAFADLDRVDELRRPGGRPLMQFVPFGSGFLGIPFCPSGDGRTCWPMKGGPDDNPFAYVCVCRVEGGPSRPPIPRPPCFLDFSIAPFRLRCVRGTCTKICRLAVVSSGKRPAPLFQVGCSCS